MLGGQDPERPATIRADASEQIYRLAEHAAEEVGKEIVGKACRKGDRLLHNETSRSQGRHYFKESYVIQAEAAL